MTEAMLIIFLWFAGGVIAIAELVDKKLKTRLGWGLLVACAAGVLLTT